MSARMFPFLGVCGMPARQCSIGLVLIGKGAELFCSCLQSTRLRFEAPWLAIMSCLHASSLLVCNHSRAHIKVAQLSFSSNSTQLLSPSCHCSYPATLNTALLLRLFDV